MNTTKKIQTERSQDDVGNWKSNSLGKITTAIFTAVLSAGLLLQTGCAVLLIGGGAAAGIGGYVFVKGELKSTENAPMGRTWTAAMAAMQELKFPVIGQNKDALTAKLIARTAQDKKVNVRLKALGENSTEIKIRVGAFGDEALSLVILDNIKKKL